MKLKEMARNSDFGRCEEERKRQSFFKIFQRADLSSQNMRALPHGFVRSFTHNDFSGKMKIKAKWGSSWEIQISKYPRFYFLEKSRWEKFVKENALGENEFVSFTHKRKMRFALNIFKQDGKEILQAPQSMAFFASSSRVKTEQREESINNDVKREEVEVSPVMSHRGPTTAGRNYAGASSSTNSELTMVITRSYLIQLAIKRAFARVHMPETDTTFKIHHPDMKRSWTELLG